jgi:VIT1/CCC1 family predicted Fe2+/Mn2+ transporter
MSREEPAPPAARAVGGRVLDPSERFAEILFGLIMVLTFTGSLSVAESGRQEVRTMLIGAIGCNLAWGVVDAIMYLLNTLSYRGRALVILRRVRAARQASDVHDSFVEALPEEVVSILRPEELESIRQRLAARSDPPARPGFERDDFRGALGVFLLVFLSTIPVVLPLLFLRDAMTALRLSNAIAIFLLFLAGYSLAKYSGYRPFRTGLVMVAIGVALVAVTIALGG